MTALQFGGEVEASGAHLVAAARFGIAIFPDRRMQAVGDGPAHQGMVSRMQLDQVNAVTLPVMRLELRSLCVCKTREILRVLTHDETTKRFQFLADRFGKVFRQLDQ